MTLYYISQITGDREWSLIAVENIMVQCSIVVTIDINIWLIDEDTGLPSLPPVVDNLCSTDCNSNGNCILGMYFLILMYSSG